VFPANSRFRILYPGTPTDMKENKKERNEERRKNRRFMKRMGR
jgi:hypothetical protein